MVMDYWCSLWFWDVRDAVELPDRQQYWQDIQQILQMDLEKKYAEIHTLQKGQQKLFDNSVQTAFAFVD